jgi:hypothetical protein
LSCAATMPEEKSASQAMPEIAAIFRFSNILIRQELEIAP